MLKNVHQFNILLQLSGHFVSHTPYRGFAVGPNWGLARLPLVHSFDRFIVKSWMRLL